MDFYWRVHFRIWPLFTYHNSFEIRSHRSFSSLVGLLPAPPPDFSAEYSVAWKCRVYLILGEREPRSSCRARVRPRLVTLFRWVSDFAGEAPAERALHQGTKVNVSSGRSWWQCVRGDGVTKWHFPRPSSPPSEPLTPSHLEKNRFILTEGQPTKYQIENH